MAILSETTKEIMHEVRIFIKEIGFPIGVAVWLLWEAHTTVKELTSTLRQMTNTMSVIEYNLRYFEANKQKGN